MLNFFVSKVRVVKDFLYRRNGCAGVFPTTVSVAAIVFSLYFFPQEFMLECFSTPEMILYFLL